MFATMKQQELIDRTLQLVQEITGRAESLQEVRHDWSLLHLPPAPNGDYSIEVYVYADGEPEISAQLVGAPTHLHFWYHPFEIYDFGSEQERDEDFIEAVRLLLTRRSRIRQKKGLFSCSFVCEVDDNGSWKRLGPGMSALRFTGFRFPPGWRRVYHSSPLGCASKTGPAA